MVMNYLVMPPKPPSFWRRLALRLKYVWCKTVCAVNGHDLTCAATEGQDPTPEQLARGVAGFFEYAKLYCKRCGYEYKLDD